MMRTFLAAAVLCLAAAPAFGQGAGGRFSVSFNAGYQAATNDFSDRFTFDVYQEQGSTQVQYPVKGDFMFDAGGAVRVWKRLGAGVTVSRFTRKAAAPTVSSVPHPLYLDQPRELTGDASGTTRTETGVHVQLLVLVASGPHLNVTAFAGPSYVNVEQDLVTAVHYQEAYPYDAPTFTGAATERVHDSAAGGHVGADVTWMFSRTLGVGGVVRYATATVKLPAPGNRTISVDAGGAQAGVGVRVHF